MNLIQSLVAGVALGGTLLAFSPADDETTCTATTECATECPTAKKVTALLASWETATAEAAKCSAEERATFQANMTELSSKCPVGCRVGEAMATVEDVLGFVVASSEANAQNCPLKDAEGEACAAGKEMQAMRAMALTKLRDLASYASGTKCAAACAETAAAETVAADTAKGEACCEGETCNEGQCPIRIASRVGAMKASFVTAQREVQALTEAQRGEILGGFGALAEKNPSLELFPQSVVALHEGLTVVNELHGKMRKWAGENPELFADMPVSAVRTFQMEVALIDEARAMLAEATSAMKLMQPKPMEVGQAD